MAAVSTAGEACNLRAPGVEEANSESTEVNIPMGNAAAAAANTGLGDTVSKALAVLDSSQATAHQREESAVATPAREAAAGREEVGSPAAPRMADGGPSLASDSSAMPVMDDSDTPRSALIPAPAAAAMGRPPQAMDAIAAAPPARKLPCQIQRGQGQPGAASEEVPCEAGAQRSEDHQSGLELARSARTLASRAAAAPLSVDHPLVKQAALEISRRTAIERSTLQVSPSLSLSETHWIGLGPDPEMGAPLC